MEGGRALLVRNAEEEIERRLDAQFAVIQVMWRNVIMLPACGFVWSSAAFLSVSCPTRSAFSAYLTHSTAESYATPEQLEKWVARYSGTTDSPKSDLRWKPDEPQRDEDYEGQNSQCVGGCYDEEDTTFTPPSMCPPSPPPRRPQEEEESGNWGMQY